MSWVIVFCSFLGLFCLIVGVMIGLAWADRQDRKVSALIRADIEADQFLEELRPRPPLPPRQRRTSTAAFLDLPGSPFAAAMTGAAGQAHEAWLAHEELALDLANDDPTVSAWTADMAASMDRWLAEHVYGVPYSADELWSGQLPSPSGSWPPSRRPSAIRTCQPPPR